MKQTNIQRTQWRKQTMKIKHIFEPPDFEGSGQMIVRNNYTNILNVCYKIGYMAADNSVALIAMSDGMVNTFKNHEELCERLNSDVLGYHPLTEAEIAAVMTQIGNRFE